MEGPSPNLRNNVGYRRVGTMKTLVERMGLAGTLTIAATTIAATLLLSAPAAAQSRLILNEGMDLTDEDTGIIVTEFTVGDKIFSNFTCMASSTGPAGAECEGVVSNTSA